MPTSTYDDLGRLKTFTEPNGALTQSSYNGLTGTVTDANNHATTKLKNSQGQLVSVTDAKAGLTTYQYDHFGNLVKTIALGVTTQMAYDRRGRKTNSIGSGLAKLHTLCYCSRDVAPHPHRISWCPLSRHRAR